MSMSKDEFNNALRCVVSEEYSRIPNEENIEYRFSNIFEKKMTSLIKKQKRFYWKYTNSAIKRVAVFCLIILLLFAALFSAQAIRDPVLKFFKEVFNTFTHYFYLEDNVDTIEREFSIHYLPEGFKRTNFVINTGSIQTVYSNDYNESIKLNQLLSTNLDVFFDNEGIKKDSLFIDDIAVDYYEKNGVVVLFWTEDDYAFILNCPNTLNEEILINIIKSIY